MRPKYRRIVVTYLPCADRCASGDDNFISDLRARLDSNGYSTYLFRLDAEIERIARRDRISLRPGQIFEPPDANMSRLRRLAFARFAALDSAADDSKGLVRIVATRATSYTTGVRVCCFPEDEISPLLMSPEVDQINPDLLVTVVDDVTSVFERISDSEYKAMLDVWPDSFGRWMDAEIAQMTAIAKRTGIQLMKVNRSQARRAIESISATEEPALRKGGLPSARWNEGGGGRQEELFSFDFPELLAARTPFAPETIPIAPLPPLPDLGQWRDRLRAQLRGAFGSSEDEFLIHPIEDAVEYLMERGYQSAPALIECFVHRCLGHGDLVSLTKDDVIRYLRACEEDSSRGSAQ